jgi:hypothetical protein
MRRRLFFSFFSFFVLFLCTQTFAAQTTTKPTGSSRSLIQQAWSAFDTKDFDRAMKSIEECIARFDLKAREEQLSLKEPIPQGKANSYWELNDVAVAKLIKAKVYIDKNQIDTAKQVLRDIVDNYSYAVSYEPRGGWYWSVSDAARRLSGDLRGSAAPASGSADTFKKKTFEAYKNGQYAAAIVQADKCIGLYRESALVQQKQLTKYPEDKQIPRYWALNDVGTCYYLAGLSALALKDRAKAGGYFQTIKRDLFYASYWDPNGWYLKITDLIADKEKEMSAN